MHYAGLSPGVTYPESREPRRKSSPAEIRNKTVSGDEECAARIGGWRPHVFKIQCFIIIIRDKQDPQILGNVALIVIQVALFALLQLVEYYGERDGGSLAIGAFMALLVVGVVWFIGTAKVNFPSIIFSIQGIYFTTEFPTLAIPEFYKEGVGWIVILTVFQTLNLGMAYWASTQIKSTWETA